MKPWFKFYGQEFLSDPKMMSLTPVEKALWITILCLASASQEEGVIRYMDENKLLMLTGVQPTDPAWKRGGFFAKFSRLGMIRVEGEGEETVLTVTNYSKRQETNLTGYERLKRHRQKNTKSVINDNANDNAVDNAPIPKKITVDIEKEKDRDKEYGGSFATANLPASPSASPQKEKPERSTGNGMTSVGALLASRQTPQPKPSGISRSWQDRAFRGMKTCGIEFEKLSATDKSKIMGMYRRALEEGRKTKNLQDMESFLADYPSRDKLTQDRLLRFVFWIYENGLQKLKERNQST